MKPHLRHCIPGAVFAALFLVPTMVQAQDDGLPGAAIAAVVIGSIIATLGILGSIATSIWFLVVAFTVHLGWGFGCLFFPPTQIVFLIMHWSAVKRPFLAGLAASVVMIIGITIIGLSAPAFLEKITQSDSFKQAFSNAAAEREMPLEPTENSTLPSPEPDHSGFETDVSKPEPRDLELERNSPVAVGDSIALVKVKLGRPSGEIKNGNETILMYGPTTITARDGQIISIKPDPAN
jgi:hypothetical protein